MKTSFIFYLLFFTLIVFDVQAQGAFRVNAAPNDYVQIGYDDYRALTFGESTNTPNNGEFGLEYWNGGFNVFKPWPSQNWGNYYLYIQGTTGRVGIGKFPTSSRMLQVNGSVDATGFVTISDKKYKKNVKRLEGTLSALMKIQPYSYSYDASVFEQEYEKQTKNLKTKDKENKKLKTPEQGMENRMGLLAQELKEVFPGAVNVSDNGDLGIYYDDLIPVLIGAIQEQQARIEALEKEVLGKKNENINGYDGLNINSSRARSENDTYIHQNAPNPFYQETSIAYSISEPFEHASLSIFNIQGDQILKRDILSAGHDRLMIDGGQYAAGTYFCTLIVDGEVIDTKQMILTR